MGFHKNFFINLTTSAIRSWLLNKAGFTHAYYRTHSGEEVWLDLKDDVNRYYIDIISEDLLDKILNLVSTGDIDDAIRSELENGEPLVKVLVEERLWPLFEKAIKIKADSVI